MESWDTEFATTGFIDNRMLIHICSRLSKLAYSKQSSISTLLDKCRTIDNILMDMSVYTLSVRQNCIRRDLVFEEQLQPLSMSVKQAACQSANNTDRISAVRVW
jgi:hypothetical protein